MTSKIGVFEEGLQTFPLRQSTASKLQKNFQGRKLSSSSFLLFGNQKNHTMLISLSANIWLPPHTKQNQVLDANNSSIFFPIYGKSNPALATPTLSDYS